MTTSIELPIKFNKLLQAIDLAFDSWECFRKLACHREASQASYPNSSDTVTRLVKERIYPSGALEQPPSHYVRIKLPTTVADQDMHLKENSEHIVCT
jgi:hypothetical protein